MSKFSFTLRWMFAFIAVVCIVLSLIASRWKSAAAQRDAIAAIHLLGGSIRYDWQPEPNVLPDIPAPTFLRSLLGDDFFDDVIAVEFYPYESSFDPLSKPWNCGDSEIDQSIPHLGKLRGLKHVDVSCVSVKSATVDKLKRSLPAVVVIIRNGPR